MNRYNQILQFMFALQEDFEKFYDNGNKAAGTRVRKGMLDLKQITQDIRKEVQEIKNE